MNWIDGVIGLFLLMCLVKGYKIGLIGSLFNLFVSIGSIVGSYFCFKPLTRIVESTFGVPNYASSVVTFVLLLIFTTIILRFISAMVWRVLDKMISALVPVYYLDRILGMVVQGALGGLIAMIVVVVMFRLPMDSNVKADMSHSYMVNATLPYYGMLEETARHSLTNLPTSAMLLKITAQPEVEGKVEMVFPQSMELKVDEDSEKKMLELVNMERKKVGIREVMIDPLLVPIARAHSTDMFVRSYFAHEDPDNLTPADRIKKGGVLFALSGENLAYAPTVQIAHQGLMNSQGHRENILRKEFSRIGVGVVDGGVYGKMFTQNFAD